MTEPVNNSAAPAGETGDASNEIGPDRGAPKVKARREQNLFLSLLPAIIVITLIGGLAIGGWFAWRAHQLAGEQTAEGAGNVASKTSIGKRRNDDTPESTRRLGADGEDPAATPAATDQKTAASPTSPQVPAIVQDNPRQNGYAGLAQGQGQAAQPIPVQGTPGNGQNAPEAPPRSRYDAPMQFGGRAPEAGPGSWPGSQPSARPAVAPAPGTSKASPGTRPDYSVAMPPATSSALQLSAAAASAPKGSLNLQTLKTDKAEASLIGNRDFLLAKGASLDCDLDTAMRSNQPGMVRCTVVKDVWSDNGRVVLAERGTTLTGEYSNNVQQGQTEIPLIWNRIKTPFGVVVELASPATDSLGRAGIDGVVDNHWGQRVGAAFLLSFVKDALGYATATHGTNTAATGVVYGNTANTGESMADTILKQTINIPATIERAHGTRVKVFVARDLDFSKVYDLQLNRRAHVE